MTEDIVFEQETSPTPFEGNKALPQKAGNLTPKEHAELAYQRELSKLAPGSAGFRMLKRSRRSMRVYNQPAVYWPTGRALTEGGNTLRRNS